MLNGDKAIVPGIGAAGIRLGASLASVVGNVATEQPNRLKYELGAVTLWARQGRIDQIGVCDGYRGKIEGRIGVGSTLAELHSAFGSITEDDEDNLVVESLPGCCFETEEWLHGSSPELNGVSKITWIFVFSGALGDGSDRCAVSSSSSRVYSANS
jgi:hypothetical protein